jgi:hypothetical protein
VRARGCSSTKVACHDQRWDLDHRSRVRLTGGYCVRCTSRADASITLHILPPTRLPSPKEKRARRTNSGGHQRNAPVSFRESRRVIQAAVAGVLNDLHGTEGRPSSPHPAHRISLWMTLGSPWSPLGSGGCQNNPPGTLRESRRGAQEPSRGLNTLGNSYRTLGTRSPLAGPASPRTLGLAVQLDACSGLRHIALPLHGLGATRGPL